MRTPKGHIRRRGNRYEIAVPVGRDPITKRYRYVYDYADSEEQAERRRATLIDQIIQGRVPQAWVTVSDLIDRWLSVAELELITTVNYQSFIERVIRPVLGGLQLREIQDRVEVLRSLTVDQADSTTELRMNVASGATTCANFAEPERVPRGVFRAGAGRHAIRGAAAPLKTGRGDVR